MVRNLLQETKLPVVLDADGINALGGHIDVLDKRGCCTILTPTTWEFARVGGDLSHGDRLRAAREFAVEHGCCLVLKGHRTITAFPDGTAYVNTTGNPGMAKGAAATCWGAFWRPCWPRALRPGRPRPWRCTSTAWRGSLRRGAGGVRHDAHRQIRRLPEVMKLAGQ